jgi:membrane-associated protein
VPTASLALNLLDPRSLLSTFGTAGVAVVLFVETGLLVGFFLPGESLLFTAGLLCAAGAASPLHLSLPWVLAAAVAGALLGAQTGFVIGRGGGAYLLSRTTNRHVLNAAKRAADLFDRYGYGKAIVLARFVPVVRTVLNPIAGAVGVPTRTFTLWQVTGGLIWTIGVIIAGYALGSSVPGVERYLLPIVAVIVLLSAIPVLRELLKSHRTP